jgi:hypothetical protein
VVVARRMPNGHLVVGYYLSSPEDLSEFMADSYNMMTEAEQVFSNIRRTAFAAITEMYGIDGPGHISQEMHQAILDKAWEKLKEKDTDNYFDENDEEFMQQFRTSVALVVESFNDPNRPR